MKTQRIQKGTMLVAIVLFAIANTNLFAQQAKNKSDQNLRSSYCRMIPDLTEDQQAKIETLRIAHLKEVNEYRNQKNELRAKKQTLMTSDNSDIKDVNSVIDQMTGIQNKMMKLTAKHRKEVRSILTDEQKVYYDSNQIHNRHQGRRHDRRHEYGRRHGRTGYGKSVN